MRALPHLPTIYSLPPSALAVRPPVIDARTKCATTPSLLRFVMASEIAKLTDYVTDASLQPSNDTRYGCQEPS